MIITKAARRYATALLQIAEEQKIEDSVLEDMVFIKNTIESSGEFLIMLKSPVVSEDDKRAVLEQVFSKHVGDLAQNFIKLAVDKNREDILLEITHAFIEAYNEAKGIVDVEVYTAGDLAESQIRELQKSLEKYLSKTVQLSLNKKPDLRGGMAVKIGDTLIDGTVKHKLEELEHTLLNKAV